MKTCLLSAATLVLATSSLADVVVQFDEGAPKDRFTISNESECALEHLTVTLDLGASASGLIFDVTEAGAGVSVFQPLEITHGLEFITTIPEVLDGDKTLALEIDVLQPKSSISLTIDVDDTAGSSETMVSGSEIQGAQVTISSRAFETTGVFDQTAVALISQSACNA